MWVKGHTVPICALQLQQGNIILPALAAVLPVDHDALRRESALKVVPLLSVVVAKPQHVTGGVSTKPEKRHVHAQYVHLLPRLHEWHQL